mmetsp:Transcript_85251/g.275123  ORF Transcript_85251/g.275123 Transcript_85251/m.275123 type:complete len:244 (+) Transcript_85251:1787-2518(+)
MGAAFMVRPPPIATENGRSLFHSSSMICSDLHTALGAVLTSTTSTGSLESTSSEKGPYSPKAAEGTMKTGRASSCSGSEKEARGTSSLTVEPARTSKPVTSTVPRPEAAACSLLRTTCTDSVAGYSPASATETVTFVLLSKATPSLRRMTQQGFWRHRAVPKLPPERSCVKVPSTTIAKFSSLWPPETFSKLPSFQSAPFRSSCMRKATPRCQSPAHNAGLFVCRAVRKLLGKNSIFFFRSLA